jgi:hypothetical protein
MNKQQIAESLVRIKALKDALDAEIKDLRQHIPVGEKIETPIGDVHHVETNRTTYDEKGLYNELDKQGIDPEVIGDVVIKVDRKKFANAITKGKIPSSLVDDFSETKSVPQLRIKPKADHNELNQSTMEKVAKLVEKG